MAYNSAYKGSQVDAAVGAVLEKETVWDGKQDKLTFDSVPTPESSSPVTSGGIASALGGKQDKLTGTSGQVVGFDESGNAVAQSAPQTGLTQATADQRYLKLNGGTMTGNIDMNSSNLNRIGAVGIVGYDGENRYYLKHDSEYQAFSVYQDNYLAPFVCGILYVNSIVSPETRAVLTTTYEQGVSRFIFRTMDGADYDAVCAGADAVGVHDFVTLQQLNARQNSLTTAISAKADKPKSVSGTLTAAGWDSTTKKQTVTVAGVLADETKQLIQPVPAIASQAAYLEAGIRCTGQAANQLIFTADTAPTVDLTVYVVITKLT